MEFLKGLDHVGERRAISVLARTSTLRRIPEDLLGLFLQAEAMPAQNVLGHGTDSDSPAVQ